MISTLEYKLVSSYKEELIIFFNAHPDCFDETINLAISDKPPYSWKAAWLLTNCLDQNDMRLKKYIPQIIKAAEITEGNHQRELLKILLRIELNEVQEGVLFNICVNIWENINNTPSERYAAIRCIFKLVKKYPDLINEISFLLEEQFIETLSLGAKRSLLKTKKDLGF